VVGYGYVAQRSTSCLPSAHPSRTKQNVSLRRSLASNLNVHILRLRQYRNGNRRSVNRALLLSCCTPLHSSRRSRISFKREKNPLALNIANYFLSNPQPRTQNSDSNLTFPPRGSVVTRIHAEHFRCKQVGLIPASTDPASGYHSHITPFSSLGPWNNRPCAHLPPNPREPFPTVQLLLRVGARISGLSRRPVRARLSAIPRFNPYIRIARSIDKADLARRLSSFPDIENESFIIAGEANVCVSSSYRVARSIKPFNSKT